jgi:ribosomal protein S12 methylthiotransferase
LVSRPIADVLREAEALVSAGVKELLVVSQDTSAYGVDLRHRTDLAGTRALRNHIVDLTRHLGSLGIWVRLHYVYPYPHVDDLVRLMGEGIVLPYLDMPLQHASPRILKLMKRPANQLATIKRIQRWREECPELTLRSTFVVGFPGETEEEFQELLEFSHEVMLDRVGCFAYSPVAGAVANALPDAVPEPVREERRLRFMQAQEEISAGRLSRRVGTEVEVLIDSVSATEATGRSAGESPEIDGVVRLTNPGALQIGDWARVRIIDSDSHDLTARVI